MFFMGVDFLIIFFVFYWVGEDIFLVSLYLGVMWFFLSLGEDMLVFLDNGES